MTMIGRVGAEIAALRNGVEPVHVGQPHVEEDEVPVAPLEGVEHSPGGGRHLDLVVLADQRLAQHEREIFVVLGDQNPLSHESPPSSPARS
jgi:hypothetical protein